MAQHNDWIEEQEHLRAQMIEYDDFEWSIDHPLDLPHPLHYLGGVDISFFNDQSNRAVAALVVLEYPSMKCVYSAFRDVVLELPYIPGFLAFREVPSLMELINDLRSKRPELTPQILFVDGNGKLHPRGFGHASHLGVVANLPTIGVGKTFFVVDGLSVDGVKASRHLLDRRGTSFPLVGSSGTVWGAALRTSDDAINPVFVSVGHRISLDTAVRAVMMCSKFRVPEPIRQADQRSREVIRRLEAAEAARRAATVSACPVPAAPVAATPPCSSPTPTPPCAGALQI